jgi:hypothetical protein
MQTKLLETGSKQPETGNNQPETGTSLPETCCDIQLRVTESQTTECRIMVHVLVYNCTIHTHLRHFLPSFLGWVSL